MPVKAHPKWKPKSRWQRIRRKAAIGLVGAVLGSSAVGGGLFSASSATHAKINLLKQKWLAEKSAEMKSTEATHDFKITKSDTILLNTVAAFMRRGSQIKGLYRTLIPTGAAAGFLAAILLAKKRRRIAGSVRRSRVRVARMLSGKLPRLLLRQIRPKPGSRELVLTFREIYKYFDSDRLDELAKKFSRIKTPEGQVAAMAEIENMLNQSSVLNMVAKQYKYFFFDAGGNLVFTNRKKP